METNFPDEKAEATGGLVGGARVPEGFPEEKFCFGTLFARWLSQLGLL